jgi:hypothetical protein
MACCLCSVASTRTGGQPRGPGSAAGAHVWAAITAVATPVVEREPNQRLAAGPGRCAQRIGGRCVQRCGGVSAHPGGGIVSAGRGAGAAPCARCVRVRGWCHLRAGRPEAQRAPREGTNPRTHKASQPSRASWLPWRPGRRRRLGRPLLGAPPAPRRPPPGRRPRAPPRPPGGLQPAQRPCGHICGHAGPANWRQRPPWSARAWPLARPAGRRLLRGRRGVLPAWRAQSTRGPAGQPSGAAAPPGALVRPGRHRLQRRPPGGIAPPGRAPRRAIAVWRRPRAAARPPCAARRVVGARARRSCPRRLAGRPQGPRGP